MHRHMDEILASQNKMLPRQGKPNPIENRRMVELFREHRQKVRTWLDDQPHMADIDVHHNQLWRILTLSCKN